MNETQKTILIIEDEADIREVLTINFESEGFKVLTADDGQRGLTLALERQPDLILLDIMLPGASGLDICRDLRANGPTAVIPIIMVTARGRESDVVLGLGLGADDYVTKPFRIAELVARAQAHLRRSAKAIQVDDSAPICFGPLMLDQLAHRASLDGEPLTLTASEFRLLSTLMGSPGRVFSRELLIDLAIGADVLVGERTIDTHIGTLRRKLKGCRDSIRTIWGVGYRFDPPEDTASTVRS